MNYYNEWDKPTAAWLRELVKSDLIPNGDVDERSITDVRPDDLVGYTQCHFFAGIGGWSYALRLAGWPEDKPVWTGSCPCQPLSCAGKRKGHADSRHLWPAFYALISECRPSTVFGEQVASKDGWEWMSAIRIDLERSGFAVGLSGLTAAGAGALHARHRLYWVASMPDTNGLRWKRKRKKTARAWCEQQFERLVQDQLQQSLPSGRLRSLSDGIPNRVAHLRGYCNAIVPQVAAQFIQAFCEIA